MRLLIEVSGSIDNWHGAFASTPDRPRLPLPFSSSAAFIARDHQVSAIHFSDESFHQREKGRFYHLYAPKELRRALAENDLAFFWAGSAIRAIVSNLAQRCERKVLFASYVWQTSSGINWRARALATATRLAARRARRAVFMTEEQARQASGNLPKHVPVLRFTWGIDASFYRAPVIEDHISAEVRHAWSLLSSKPYVILAGDQQRIDGDAIKLVEEFDIRLVRVPQEHSTAAWYHRQIRERNLEGRLFVFERVNYPTLRFLFRNAAAYAGLVDSSWQPAGWTVLCEAFASGIPAVVYEGLTTREMRRLGAGDYLLTTERGNVKTVADYCAQLLLNSNNRRELSSKAQTFSSEILDLERTGAAFVQAVEEMLRVSQNLSARVLLAHPGTQHSFHLARELDKRGALDSFYTGFAWRPAGFVDRVMRRTLPGLSRRLGNRRLDPFFSASLNRRSWNELIALLRSRRGKNEQRVMHSRNEAFQRSISDDALRMADAVIGVDTASWIIARRCRELGRCFVLDQTIGHPFAKQAMHAAVRRQFPSWQEGFEDRAPEVLAAETSEQADATRIVIGSSFAKQTLVDNGIAPEKIEVIPYGVDLARFRPTKSATARPFRFVFVGIITARKGVPLLFEAWKKLAPNEAELWLVGSASREAQAAIPHIKGLEIKNAVPQADVPGLMRQCDVFVLPSYFEGFGLVILEAMACGLPAITTTATAGPDIISRDQDGWVIQPGDLDGLVETMRFCLENPDRVVEISIKARATAEKFSWDAYGDRWMEIIEAVTGR